MNNEGWIWNIYMENGFTKGLIVAYKQVKWQFTSIMWQIEWLFIQFIRVVYFMYVAM